MDNGTCLIKFIFVEARSQKQKHFKLISFKETANSHTFPPSENCHLKDIATRLTRISRECSSYAKKTQRRTITIFLMFFQKNENFRRKKIVFWWVLCLAIIECPRIIIFPQIYFQFKMFNCFYRFLVTRVYWKLQQ